MDIASLGEKNAAFLFEKNYVGRVSDLYRFARDAAAVARLAAEEGWGETSAKNLAAGVEASRARPLARVVTGLGIPGVGEGTARDLATAFGDLAHLRAARAEAFEAVPEIGETLARNLVAFFANPLVAEELDRLGEEGIGRGAEGSFGAAREKPLAGKTFVVTGADPSMPREAIEEGIRVLGGRAAASVSKKTDCVYFGDAPGSKLEKARSLGISTRPLSDLVRDLREWLP